MSSRIKEKELQGAGNLLSESQDFKDLETASSSRSAHCRGKPFFFPIFHDSFAAPAATVLTRGI